MVTVKKLQDVSPRQVSVPGVRKVWIRRLIGMSDGAPTFAMRLFEVEPGGYTPLHTHEHEHEVFIVSGRGVVKGPWGERGLVPDTVVFIPPREEHHFLNTDQEPLRFLCLVPLAGDA
jgi:quercetin dioxygenase-like cupin family protein